MFKIGTLVLVNADIQDGWLINNWQLRRLPIFYMSNYFEELLHNYFMIFPCFIIKYYYLESNRLLVRKQFNLIWKIFHVLLRGRSTVNFANPICFIVFNKILELLLYFTCMFNIITHFSIIWDCFKFRGFLQDNMVIFCYLLLKKPY